MSADRRDERRADPLYRPIAAPDVSVTRKNTTVDVLVLANDSDPNGDALRVIAVVQLCYGSTTINADGSVRYTPDNNFVGDDSFEYTITDDSSGPASVTVRVSVQEP